MATRQLTLKRTIYDSKKNIKRGLPIFIDDILMNMCFNGPPDFKRIFYKHIMHIAKEIDEYPWDHTVMFWVSDSVPSDIEFEIDCVNYISTIVNYFKGRELKNRQPLNYTFLKKEVLPEMWRSRKEIELKRQRKLEDLANLLDNDGRYQEAHVIRIIVKPHHERMNRKWTNMTALEKFKSLLS